MDVSILYEDENIIAVDKPAGLVVHSDGRTKESTLVDWFLQKYPNSKHVGEPVITSSKETILRSGIVHRLDRDTSGVLLIAKTNEGFECLKKQFQDRSIKKIYNTFVYGIVKDDEGTINRPIARSRKDFRLWSAQRGGRGETRDAITNYKVIKRNKNIGEGGATYVEAHPLTGRTHQIRVHFKAINHPVVADTLYAPKKEPLLGFKRLALHARFLKFENCQGKLVEIEAPYPPDFEFALSQFTC